MIIENEIDKTKLFLKTKPNNKIKQKPISKLMIHQSDGNLV